MVNRDHHPAKLCLTWQFSNQHEVARLEPYQNLLWLYVATGHMYLGARGGEHKRYEAGSLVNVKELSGKDIECTYPETGAFTFWVNGLDGRNRHCQIIECDNQHQLNEYHKERWVGVVSGHVDANDRHIPTRTLARIPPNTKVLFKGVTPKTLLGNREEIENISFILAVFEDA